MESVDLSGFNLASVPDDAVCLLIGKRNTGKTSLIKNLLYFKQSFPIGIAIECLKNYRDILPSLLIHEEFHAMIVSRLLERQSAMHERIREGAAIDRRAFLCMDDCLYDNRWVTDRHMLSLFQNGRQYGLLTILAMQYPLGIPPSIKSCVDYLFVMHETMVATRRRIYEQFVSDIVPSFDVFNTLMDRLEGFRCLVIKKGVPFTHWSECVFLYRAELHPPFKIGSPALWERSAEYERSQEAT